MWITDPKTKVSSVSLTFAVISFILVIVCYIVTQMVAPFFHLGVPGFDTAAAGLLLTTTFGLYFGRRFGDSVQKPGALPSDASPTSVQP